MGSAVANPFNPQFGKRPEQFVGRDLIVNGFLQSLNERNDPKHTTIVTGIRGAGKTALLSDVAANLGGGRFLVIDVTVGNGMLLEVLDEFAAKGKPWPEKRFDKIKGLTAGALGFSFGLSLKDSQETHGFRYYVTELLGELKKQRITTVFLLDEVHLKTDEMRVFAITYQHLVREDMDVALLMAGLPGAVLDILNDQVLTFLRRAYRVELGDIDPKVFQVAYQDAFGRGGRNFGHDALRDAAQATKGYPYLFQLLGYYLWQSGKRELGQNDVARALALSKVDLFQNVHALLFRDLSAKDREFLFAMVPDTMSTKFGDITERLDVSKGYASQYRRRLMEAGLIVSQAHGQLSFRLPYMREFLQERLAGFEEL
jgi:hypothetical protein